MTREGTLQADIWHQREENPFNLLRSSSMFYPRQGSREKKEAQAKDPESRKEGVLNEAEGSSRRKRRETRGKGAESSQTLKDLERLCDGRLVDPQFNKRTHSAQSSASRPELVCGNHISLKHLDRHDKCREVVIALPSPHTQHPSYRAPRSRLAGKIDTSFKPRKKCNEVEIGKSQVAIEITAEADGVMLTDLPRSPIPILTCGDHISVQVKPLDGHDHCAKTVNAPPARSQGPTYLTLQSCWGSTNHTALKAQKVYDEVEIVEPQTDIEFPTQSMGDICKPFFAPWVDSSCSSKRTTDLLLAVNKFTLDVEQKSYDISIPCNYIPSSSMDKIMICIANSLVEEFAYILSYEISVEHALDHARCLTRSLIRLGAPLSGWNSTVQSILRVVEKLHALRSTFSNCMSALREQFSKLNEDAQEASERTTVTCHTTEVKMLTSLDKPFTLKSALDTLTLKLKEADDERLTCEKKLRVKLSYLLVELSSLFST